MQNIATIRAAVTLRQAKVSEITDAARALKAAEGGTIKGHAEALSVEVERQKAARFAHARFCRRSSKVSLPFLQRLKPTLEQLSERAIRERGLGRPTDWPGGYVRNRVGKLWVYGAEYRIDYKSAGNWWGGAAYLCGVEHGQLWAVRVPRWTHTVQHALDFIIPAAVRKARAAGRDVRRQGDVWFVPARTDNLSDLPWGHKIEGEEVRYSVHSQHGRLELPAGKIKVYVNKSVFGGGRVVD